MHRGRAYAALIVALTVWSACDSPDPDPDAGTDDAGPEPDTGVADGGVDASGPTGDCDGPPGLYMSGMPCGIVAPGVREYRPRHVLWSDDAEKQRFIFLPTGTQIDTSNPDDWAFPVGTRIYKNFTVDGMLVETRVLEKHQLGTGPVAWYMRTYAWNAAGDRATEVTNADLATRTNVLGTDHDIPSGEQCIDCHSGSLDTANSFTAIQLNHSLGGLNLETLMAEGWLTAPIDLDAARIPGNETEQAALGYLHANCGNCHRQTPSGGCGMASSLQNSACSSGLLTWVRVADTTVADTTTYQTSVGRTGAYFHPSAPTARCRIHPGEPDLSFVYLRMGSRMSSQQMPPIGTEFVHTEGLTILETWIESLTDDPTPCL